MHWGILDKEKFLTGQGKFLTLYNALGAWEYPAMNERHFSLTAELVERIHSEIARQNTNKTRVSNKATNDSNKNLVTEVENSLDNPKGMGIKQLDRLCWALGFQSFVQFASGQPAPRPDMKTLQRAVRLAMRPLEIDPRYERARAEQGLFVPLDYIAACAAVMYVAMKDPSRKTPPDAGELAWRTVQLIGPYPKTEEQQQQWLHTPEALEILG